MNTITICGIDLLIPDNFVNAVRDPEVYPFIKTNNTANIQRKITYEVVEKIDIDLRKATLEFNERRYSDPCFTYHYAMSKNKIEPFFFSRIGKDEINISVLKTMTQYFDHQHSWLKAIGIESFLIRNNGLMMHSSLIKIHNISIMFCASSGSGKSTQAELWRKYKEAEILNGDRTGVISKDGTFWAYSIPIAGTSRICKNDGAPLKAIITLEHGKTNELVKLNQIEAFRKLWPEVNLLRSDQILVDMALNVLIKLIDRVPVYLLRCVPDDTAVNTLYEEIFKETKKTEGI